MADDLTTELVAALGDRGWRGVLAVTGGGASAVAELLATPGASRWALEARVPYSAAALAEWVGGPLESAASEAVARRMAMAAWRRSRHLAGAGAGPLVGVGCSAALATTPPRRGGDRAHVAVQTSDRTLAVAVAFEKHQFERATEERHASHAIVAALAHAVGVRALRLDRAPPGVAATLDEVVAPREWSELLTGARRASPLHGASERPGLLVPGSFNPLHEGHAALVRFAERRTGRLGALELSITNVDKPPLDFLELRRRLSAIGDRPLLLTDAPTFVEKAELAPGCVFAVGADTALRIAEPRYYPDGQRGRDAAVARVAASGCRLLVFGREVGGRFLDLDDLPLPAALRRLCDGVSADEFRVDASSTTLRAGE